MTQEIQQCEMDIESVRNERDQWNLERKHANSSTIDVAAERACLEVLEQRIALLQKKIAYFQSRSSESTQGEGQAQNQVLTDSILARERFTSSFTQFEHRKRAHLQQQEGQKQLQHKLQLELELIEEDIFKSECEIKTAQERMSQIESHCRILMQQLAAIVRARRTTTTAPFDIVKAFESQRQQHHHQVGMD